MRPQTAVAAGAHSGDGPRVTDGLQVLYTFHEGSGGAVYDVSGVGSPLNLTIANTNAVTWQSGGGLQVNTGASKTIIESGVAAGKIINAVAASNEVTIEAWIKPANISQDGPARILTISGDASNRNAMLGQGLWGSQPKDLYNVRLRTSHWSINNNGMPALDGTTGSAATNLTHVVYTRDGNGNAVLYVNGSVDATGNVPGDLSNWDGSYRLALADEFGSGGGREWAGTFYLAAIYDKALSAAEVTQNYLAGSAQPTPTATATTPATHTPTPPATPSPTATPPPAGPSLIQRSAYSLAGQAIAVRVVEKDAGGQVLSNNLYYYLTDHLGSTAQLLNGGNGIVSGSTTRYLPYGGYRTTPTDDVTDRHFTGHRHNDDLGLIYMNARFYVGGIGRFVTADTIVPDPANPQSFNRYTYVLNSPLNLVDPTGHYSCNISFKESGVCVDAIIPSSPSSLPKLQPLINFDGTEGESWTAAEKAAVTAGAWRVAGKLFEAGGGRGGQFSSWRDAFLKVYGGSVTFRKTGQSCAEATGAASCYAQVQSSRMVHVYTNIYDSNGNSRIPGPNTSDRWTVHELGHAFESRANGKIGTWGHVRSQLPDNVLNRAGFAGGFPGWQQSQENTGGEIFADMFVGWAYGQWGRDLETGALTDEARLKTDFMTTNMSIWIDIATRP